MEAAETSGAGHAGHHLFDVRVRQMVAKVDQALATLARRLGQQHRCAPVVIDRRVERGRYGLCSVKNINQSAGS